MTDRERFERLEALFHQLAGLPQAERRVALDDIAREDPALFAELKRLLELPSGVATREEALEALGAELHTLTGAAANTPEIPGFVLVRVLGEGGMGRVWEAQQLEPVQRRVALKVMRTGLDSERVVARFEAERQALAVMDHPSIARVYDAGTTTTGQPWFAMELVDGEPITDWADQHQLDLEKRLELVLQVCSAVQHAHAKGVIHRDLKPSNLLVTMVDGRPVPKVVDFGIAKSIEQPLLARSIATRFGELIGTPEYMSPEQASLGAVDIDTRSDVYSLGLVLFELLVGELPLMPSELRGFAFDELCRRIREEDTPRPSDRLITRAKTHGAAATRITSERARQLRGDLDRVVLKALAKDRDHRYGSAAELGADLQRYLRHEPVLATPPSWGYRLRKLVRRHRVAAFATIAVALSLVTGLAVAVSGLLEARRAEAEARASEAQTRTALATVEATQGFLLDLFRSVDPRAARGADPTARELLERGIERIDQLEAEPQVQAALLEAMGEVSWALGAFTHAQPLLERAIVLRSGAATDPLRHAFALDRLGALHRDRAELGEAEAAHRKALEVLDAASARDTLEAARSLNNLGITLRQAGRLDEAELAYERAIEITRSLGGERSSELLARCLANLAPVRQVRGDSRGALDATLEALETFAVLLPAGHPDFGLLHNNAALQARSIGELAVALEHGRKAVEISRATLPSNHPSLGTDLHGLGVSQLRLGLLEDARQSFEESLTILRGRGESERFWTTLPNASLGAVALAAGDPERARNHFEVVLAELAVSDHPQAPRHALGYHRQLATAERRLGDVEAALRTAETGLELARALSRPEDQALASLQVAQIAAALGREDDAERAWTEALELSGCGDAPCGLDRAETTVLRATWWVARGDLDRAFQALEWAIDHTGWTTTMLEAPELEPLRGDPRWGAVEGRLGRRVGG